MKNITELKPFDAWLKSIDKSPATGWRWRRRGMINVINICGRNYLSNEEIGRFMSRAQSGEFSNDTHPPMKKAITG